MKKYNCTRKAIRKYNITRNILRVTFLILILYVVYLVDVIVAPTDYLWSIWIIICLLIGLYFERFIDWILGIIYKGY